MPVEVRSPVSRPGSKVGSIRSGDLSPGARSNPSRGDRGLRDSGNNMPEPSYRPPGQQTHDRRDAEPETPERGERERADSLTSNVFGLIKRMLPRKQPPPKPYTFIGFVRYQPSSPLAVLPSGATRANALPTVRRSRLSSTDKPESVKSFAVYPICRLPSPGGGTRKIFSRIRLIVAVSAIPHWPPPRGGTRSGVICLLFAQQEGRFAVHPR
jgi:hypothetical protein